METNKVTQPVRGGPMPVTAKFYVGAVIALGAAALLNGLANWECHDPARFLLCFLIAVLGSGLKVNLPGIFATISANFLFILVGIVHLSLPETLLLGYASVLVQCCWKSRRKPQLVQVVFNLASTAINITLSFRIFHSAWLRSHNVEFPLLLAMLAVVYFVLNTLPVTMVIALTEGKRVSKLWQECYFWSFPYYLVGAAAVGSFSLATRVFGLQTTLLVLPVVYVVFRSYRLYTERLETEKRRAEEEREHAQQMAALHLRTIEALALAIEAKDHITHDHLKRVQTYALEIGKELKLTDVELNALRAAAVLHDIGKLAVPEHIISKPGRLTPEEFEKMKIHPVVGAEILERVQFPYPVAPIVAAHHEKWDGTGYPAGLAAEQIPIGARILSAVDCLDALASDRQYRPALPIADAMRVVVSESGKAFDPQVVAVLERRYLELERLVRAIPNESPRLSTDLKIERGKAPAAGFERVAERQPSASGRESIEFLASIAAARREVQILFELAQDLGNSLSLDDTLSVLAMRLRKLIPYDAMAIYVTDGKNLRPVYADGDRFGISSSLEVPIGGGISGWVAHNRKPIVNGNAAVECLEYGRLHDLQSALSVPLEGTAGVVGALTLYGADADAFTRDHLRILLAISSKLSQSIENSLKFRQVEDIATIDFLTGLPNARSLFLQLEQEVARCKSAGASLTVFVCDLDGFKQVNDRLGHLEGNRLLEAVAGELKKACREDDYVARMGGDEFVIVMSGLSKDAARETTARLSYAASKVGWDICGEDVLSLSVGQAHLPDDGRKAEELLAAADREMYQSKRRQKTQRLRLIEPPVDPAIAGKRVPA